MKKILLLIVLTPLLNSCYLGEDVPEDQQVWSYAQPGEAGMSELVLNQLDLDIKSQLFGNTTGLMIIKDDKVVFENYYLGTDRSSLLPVSRIGTALVMAVFGEVLNNKLGNRIDTPVYRFFPEYSNLFEADPIKKEITIEHLLLMTDGLAWNESIIEVDQEGSNLSELLQSPDMPAYLFGRQIEAPPGRRFSYNSGCSVLLLYLMDKLLDQPVEELFEERIFSNLEIDNYQVSRTPDGLPNFSLGLSMTQLDLTKIGYLILKKGNWQGSQLIDNRWVDQFLSQQLELSNQNDFGYHFYQFNTSSFIFQNYAVDDIFYVFGSRSQGLFISESRNLVVMVNNGFDPERSFNNSSFWVLTRVLDSEASTQF